MIFFLLIICFLIFIINIALFNIYYFLIYKNMNSIKDVIKKKEQKCFLFCPNASFYKAVEINQKRWGQIYRGQIVPTLTEAKAIAEYFEVPVTDLID